jgi:hypothetical protein
LDTVLLEISSENKPFLFCSQPNDGSEMKMQMQVQKCGPELPRLEYRAPERYMVDEYGAVVEWLIMGESRRKLEENLLPFPSLRTSNEMAHG